MRGLQNAITEMERSCEGKACLAPTLTPGNRTLSAAVTSGRVRAATGPTIRSKSAFGPGLPWIGTCCATSSFSRLMFLNSATALALTFWQIASRGRRPVKVRVDHDLLLRQIGDQHVVAVVETIDVIEFDRLIAVADRVADR